MKIRYGFVSNSSSSSFCIRGYKASRKELKELIDSNVSDDEPDCEFLEGCLYWILPKGFEVESTRFYFGGDDTGEFVIGKSMRGFDDGVVFEVPRDSDEDIDISKTLNDIFGLKTKPEDMRTYIQYVSNDNY